MYMTRTLHFTLSNTLIATQNYVNNDKSAEYTERYAVSVNSAPNLNEINSYIGTTGRSRPLKHYRKRLLANSTYSKVSLSAFETPGGTFRTTGCSTCNGFVIQNNKLLQNTC